MTKIIKQLLIILGSLLVGSGIGIIAGQGFNVNEGTYWLIVIGTLVLGGFILAVGMMTKEEKKEQFKEKGIIEEEEVTGA